MNKKILPFLIFFAAFSCFSKTNELKQGDVPELMDRFLYMHVKYKKFDDELSERTLNNYIMVLDYGKYYFYKSDVESFQQYKRLLDDYVKMNNYEVVTSIFDIYKKRFSDSIELVDDLLKEDYNFNLDETIVTDRESVDYPATEKEMRERWRKNIKLQLLNYMSTNNDINYAKNKLKKKYELAAKRVEKISRANVLSKFMNAWTMALDPHSNYLTAEENEDFRIAMELKLEGIGVRLRSDDGFVLVDSIITGGASDKLPTEYKLKPSDKIVAVSQDSKDWTDVIDMELSEVVKLIRGKKGTKVYLTIVRENEESGKTQRLTVPIVREEIKLQDSEAKADMQTMRAGKGSVKIGYINLPSFYQGDRSGKSSAGDVKKLLASLAKQNIDGLVLDLRGNPGGLLGESIEIAGMFINNGPVVQVKDAFSAPLVYSDNDFSVEYSGPMVLLIDKFSASASEILAGAMKDYRRALILGSSNSYGKGTVQSYSELGGGLGAIKVTTHIFYQPGGSSNQGNGIEPDILIPDITSVWDSGENKLKYPLDWKPIEKAKFTQMNLVNPSISKQLQSKSDVRVSGNKEFVKLKEQIGKLKKQIAQKSISLKEEASIEKQREAEAEKASKRDKSEKKIIDLEGDLFLSEAFNVTRDYIQLLKER